MLKRLNLYYYKHPKIIKLLFLPLLLGTLSLIISLLYLNFLSDMFIYIIIAFLVGIVILFYYLFNRKTKKGIFPYKTFILSLVLCLFFFVFSFYIVKSKQFINNAFSNTQEEIVMSLVVLKDSKASTINDIDKQKIALNKKSDPGESQSFINDLDKKISIELVETNDFNALVNRLFNQEVSAIIINESKRFLIETYYPNFSSDTKIIYQYKITQKIKSTTNDLDITKDTFNVLISGLDTYGDINTVSRSDVNLLVTINPRQHEILITNIPRDYWITLGTIQKKDKLTHAGIYSINESVTTIEQLFDLKINYYACVNYNSLTTIINVVDGVEIDNPYELGIPNTSFYFPKGTIILNGEQALAFVRERHSLPNGDEDRGRNQQKVLTALIQKLLSPQLLTNYLTILDSLRDSLITNVSINEISVFVKSQLSSMATWKIKTTSVTGTGSYTKDSYSIPGQNVYITIPDQQSINAAKKLITDMQSNHSIITE